MEESTEFDDLDPEEDQVPAGSQEDQGATRGDNSNFRQVRGELKRTAKERDALRAQVDELLAQVREREEREAAAKLAEAGLNEQQVEVFRKAYGDATPENIAAFQTVLGRPAQAPTVPTFEPTVFTGGETSVESISKTEFEKLVDNPQTRGLAQQYAERNLVDWTRR